MAESLSDIVAAGFSPTQSSPFEQILSTVSGGFEKAAKQREENIKREQEQVELYTKLRDAGYTKETASERVGRTFRSTDFIENIVLKATGQDRAFVPPTEEPLKTQKELAEISLTGAKAKYYNEGGSRKFKDANSMTTGQMQSELSRISDPKKNVDYGSDESQQYVDFLTTELQKRSKYKTPSVPSTKAAVAKKYASGSFVTHQGKRYKVTGYSPAGKLLVIPA